MKTVLCLSVVLMLAACGGKSEAAAEAQPPKQEANNSPGEQVIQNREKAMNAAKSVEDMQKKQAEQIDEQAK